jgi:hypothetical protein
MNGYKIKIFNQSGSIAFETNVEGPIYEVNLSSWTGSDLMIDMSRFRLGLCMLRINTCDMCYDATVIKI